MVDSKVAVLAESWEPHSVVLSAEMMGAHLAVSWDISMAAQKAVLKGFLTAVTWACLLAAPMERLWDLQKEQKRAVLLENQKAWHWAAKKAAPMVDQSAEQRDVQSADWSVANWVVPMGPRKAVLSVAQTGQQWVALMDSMMAAKKESNWADHSAPK